MRLALVLPLLLVLGAGAPTPAQQAAPTEEALAEYSAGFAAGLEAMQARDLPAVVAAFERCLELVPEDPASAYNLACAHAVGGAAEPALDWLERATAWGFGSSPDDQTLLDGDPDLESLRALPRFAEVLQAVAARRAALATWAAEPAVYVPEAVALAGDEPRPLLVVLHDYGETKETVVSGPWRAVADALGMVLLAPSGTVALGPEPAEGMGWFSNTATYDQRPWAYERTIDDALRAFRGEHAVDRRRVVVAGAGQGGTVALHVGLAYPAFFRVALSLEGIVSDALLADQLEIALRHDLRLHLLVDLAAVAEPERPQLAAAAQAFGERLAASGLDVTTSTWMATGADEARVAAIVAVLQELLPDTGG